ncbi:MAG: triphosphoribosyl-dephospho-CoA synthase CitG [Lachnospiraceae bacterium]|nr:triphosphoribosyl-dephospho-CoA synthase CitG [Lachnospiraceae bacterium]
MDTRLKNLENYAYKALLLEVYTSRKPGLVDLCNCGSHEDMDVSLFEKSAAAIKPFLGQFAKGGAETVHVPKEELLKELRPIGIQAEKAMFEATGGVNTHKGMIYSMGLLMIALGREVAMGQYYNEELLWETVSVLGKSTIKTDFNKELIPGTSGEKQYKKYGLTGARGEAALGMPSVRLFALPLLEKRANPDNLYRVGAGILTQIMANLEDSNMISRSNKETAFFIRKCLKNHFDATGDEAETSKCFLNQLDELFIKYHLSPGGAADLLAISYFLFMVKRDVHMDEEKFKKDTLHFMEQEDCFLEQEKETLRLLQGKLEETF